MKRALFFFTFKSNQQCKKSIQKEKLQSREQKVCALKTSFPQHFF